MKLRGIFGWVAEGRPEPEKPAMKHSNGQYTAYGYGQNGKGYCDDEHDKSKKWSRKDTADTGLTDREPL